MKTWDQAVRIWHSDWKMVGYAFVAVLWYNLGQVWTSGWTRWLSMLMTVTFTVWLAWHWRLSRRELGLQGTTLQSGLRWGGAAVVLVMLVLGAAYLIRPETFIDSRYHIGWGRALLVMLVMIPLQTVIFEEFLFRGVLLSSLWRVTRLRWAVLASSLAFGLWHIEPSLYLSTSSETLHQVGGQTTNPALAAVLISVLSTAAAGVLFAWLKLRSRSLVAPVLAHWAINALSVAFVVAAYARLH